MEFVSGRNVEKRKEFQKVLEDAALDRFDVLLVDHTSRFGRNQAECIRYKAELDLLGKTVVFVSQGIISGSDCDFVSERINETLDEQYSRNLSRYICSGLAAKAAEGLASMERGRKEQRCQPWDIRRVFSLFEWWVIPWNGSLHPSQMSTPVREYTRCCF